MPVLSTLGAAIANVYGFTSGLIKDQYFNLVSLLLPGNGTNGANNNEFLDSGTANSGSGFTITRNGNTTQGTFSPFSQTGWGNYFNGDGNYLSASYSTDWAFPGDFSIEAWFNVQDAGRTHDSNKYGAIISQGASASITDEWAIFFLISGGVITQFQNTVGGSQVLDATGQSVSLNAWHHFVLCRSGSTISMFVDGNRIATNASYSTSIGANASGTLQVARSSYGPNYQNWTKGYFSNIRILKGSSAYTASSSTLTVPTSPLTAVTNTKLLTCQSNRFVDANTQVAAKTITVTGSPSVTPFSPFAPTQSYSAAAVGGSGYFDGTGDYVQAASNAAFAIGTGDFAIECFVYFTGTAQGGGTSGELFGSTTTGSIVLRYKSGTLALSRVNTADDMSASVTLTPNQWYHICATRTGTTGALYLNGTRVGTASSYTASYAQGDIGTINNTQGYLTCCRLIKAANPYGTDTTITVPTAPLTAVSGTSLLLNFTNAGVVDATAKNVLETVGNAQISTTQSKWGGGSIYFDGNGDRATMPGSALLALGSGDFTVEAWVYKSANTAYMTLCGNLAVAGENVWQILADVTGNKICWYNGASSSFTITSSTTLNTGAWYYIAFVRSGSASNNFKLYINGSLDTQATMTTNYDNTSRPFFLGHTPELSAGRDWNGYVDDFRITKGYARTITASPTAPFPVQ